MSSSKIEPKWGEDLMAILDGMIKTPAPGDKEADTRQSFIYAGKTFIKLTQMINEDRQEIGILKANNKHMLDSVIALSGSITALTSKCSQLNSQIAILNAEIAILKAQASKPE
jgi:uncharacterized small protein (DUF1192 family)